MDQSLFIYFRFISCETMAPYYADIMKFIAVMDNNNGPIPYVSVHVPCHSLTGLPYVSCTTFQRSSVDSLPFVARCCASHRYLPVRTKTYCLRVTNTENVRPHRQVFVMDLDENFTTVFRLEHSTINSLTEDANGKTVDFIDLFIVCIYLQFIAFWLHSMVDETSRWEYSSCQRRPSFRSFNLFWKYCML